MKIKDNKITDIDKDIIKYISENKNFESIIENDDRIEIMLALSDIRKNIISWYPFEKNCTILEIGADYGQITEELCKNAEKVISYEANEEKRNAILKRHENIKNLEIIDSLENIKTKFDYITLIGLENITDDIVEIFKYTQKMLKDKGKLLIAFDNKYSVKSFSTQEKLRKMLDSNRTMYSLEKVKELLENAGFKYSKIYYPLTDYKITNVILGEDRKLKKDEFTRNIIYNNKDDIKCFDENELIYKLIKDNISFQYFANSFFIEAYNSEEKKNEIRLVAFSNMRKNKYKIKTIMEKDFVYKYPDNEESKKHIMDVKRNIDILKKLDLKTLDNYDEEKIISRYVKNSTFDEIILQTAKNEPNKAIEMMKNYKDKLIKSLPQSEKTENVFDRYGIKYNLEIIKNMKFTKYGLWDMIFQNCFYIDNEFYFYDQEWMEEDIPIDFIVYRAIKYFTKIRKYINIEELYNKLEIDDEKIKIFEELDNKLQEKSRNNQVWELQKNGKDLAQLKIQKLTDNHTINLLNIELGNKNREIEELKQKNNELEEKNKIIQISKEECEQKKEELDKELQNIKNSRSWKMVTTLKKIVKR